MKLLLLTSSIHPKNVINKIENMKRNERENQYTWTLKYYIEKSDFDSIVYVDNTNYILKYIHNMHNENTGNSTMIEIEGKVIEYIKFDWNKYSNIYWYGYWDQEIMDYAFKNSILLNKLDNNESFFKISWRYVLRNINNIIKNTEHIWNMFLKSPIYPFNIQTAIVKIKKSDYRKYIYLNVKSFFEKWKNKNLKLLLENIWYIMLREIVHNNRIWKRIYNIYYQYDWKLIFRWPNIPFLAKISYYILDFFKFNQHIKLFKIIDKIFYNKRYTKNK